MDPSPRFVFGTHPDHGFVAAAHTTAALPAHLANWFLTRVQFEPVPGDPGLYRLTDPDQDGRRRTRQAVHDLRRHGSTVHADIALDPAQSAGPPTPLLPNGLSERRSRIAQAAGRSPHQRPVPAPSAPAVRQVPPEPGYTPTVRLRSPTTGRSR
ncbi:hypothetical protein OG949_35125 [Streptomyces scopuliridis]|uniref:hypothetical protein n=1 Tax=Streptomyces scopuliridis TaxID=452529 RepID=UPI002DD91AFD|nr:hypothetical protein [Streptomyces scopuliridis]WSB37545.1 hypothetical protein OG949_35125 [Streptomyces scopuliridis]